MILIGNGHNPKYSCSVSGCSYLYSGTISNHTGATHENDGRCTTCNYQYQNHSQSSTIKTYTMDSTGHTPIYGCTESNCESTYTGSAENHTGGTHENDGKCTVCNYKYQNHVKSEEIDEYEKNDSTHTPIYKCTYSNCTHRYNGNSESHFGGTHENGGKCEVCDINYQKHSQSNTIVKYQTTTSEHIPIYKCTFNDCEFTYTGESKEHRLVKWTDNGNETHTSKCEDCQYEVKEEHNYQNGKCTKCNAIEKEKECEHTYIKKSNNTQHWEECEKCGDVKTDSLKNHNFEKYIDNENGTHSSTCIDCQYEVKEEHNYQNGKCTKCNAIEKEKECEHTYIKKNNNTQHWEECEKCGEVKSNTLKNHEFKDYKDNKDGTHSSTCTECNYKLTEKHTNINNVCVYCKTSAAVNSENDNKNNGTSGNKIQQNNSSAKEPDKTISKEKLPYTGKSIIVFISTLILINIAIISIIKLKKYDDVK